MTAGEFLGTLIALILLTALSASLFFTLIDLYRKIKSKPDRLETSETLYTCSGTGDSVKTCMIQTLMCRKFSKMTKTSGRGM